MRIVNTTHKHRYIYITLSVILNDWITVNSRDFFLQIPLSNQTQYKVTLVSIVLQMFQLNSKDGEMCVVTATARIVSQGWLLPIQGTTNSVSRRPGQPEKGSGQPELGVWLPNGQPRFTYVLFLDTSEILQIPLTQ